MIKKILNSKKTIMRKVEKKQQLINIISVTELKNIN